MRLRCERARATILTVVSLSSSHGNLHFSSRRRRVRDRYRLSLLSLPFDDLLHIFRLLSAKDVIRLRIVGVPSQLSLHVLTFVNARKSLHTTTLYRHVSGLDLVRNYRRKIPSLMPSPVSTNRQRTCLATWCDRINRVSPGINHQTPTSTSLASLLSMATEQAAYYPERTLYYGYTVPLEHSLYRTVPSASSRPLDTLVNDLRGTDS